MSAVSLHGGLFLAAVYAGGLIALALTVYARRSSETESAIEFSTFTAGISLWAFCAALAHSAGFLRPVLAVVPWVSPADWTIGLLLAANAVSVFTVVLWLEFVVAYVGKRDQYSDRIRAVLWGEALLFALVECVLPFLGVLGGTGTYLPPARNEVGIALVERTPSLFGSVQAVFGYVLAVAVFALLLRFLFRTRNVHRKQAAAILLAFLPLGPVSLLYTLRVSPVEALDLTPFFLAVSGSVVALALFRYDFLTVAPMAADLLLEDMDDPVMVVDEDGGVLEANPAARSMVRQDLEGERLERVLPAVASALDAEPEERGTISVDADGTHAEYDPKVTPIRDQHDVARGFLVVLNDVSALKDRERRLKAQNEQLEQFANVVSHDLRNPLSIAIGYSDAARAGDDAAHDRIDRALAEMDDMIEELLALARNGRAVDDPEVVDLADAFERAWKTVDTGEMTYSVEVDGSVEADPSRLRELLANLIRNAREHAGDDVTVTVGALDEGTGVFVADDGDGFDGTGSNMNDDGFDDGGFDDGGFDGDPATVFTSGYTTTESGTGLGLSIVKTIAEAHGWQVNATTSADGGARFEFRGVERVDQLKA